MARAASSATNASVLGAGGIKRHEVELLLGHRTTGTTGLYTHLFREAFSVVEGVLRAAYSGFGTTGRTAVAAEERTEQRTPGAIAESTRRRGF